MGPRCDIRITDRLGMVRAESEVVGVSSSDSVAVWS